MKDPTKMLCLSLESHNPALSIDMQLNVVPLLCPELWCFKVEFQKKLWWFFNSFCQTLKLAALKKLPYLRMYLTYRKLMPTVGTGRPSRFQKGVTRFCSLNTFRVIDDQRLCNIFPDTRYMLRWIDMKESDSWKVDVMMKYFLVWMDENFRLRVTLATQMNIKTTKIWRR